MLGRSAISRVGGGFVRTLAATLLLTSLAFAQDQEFWSKARVVYCGPPDRKQELMLRIGPSQLRDKKTAPQGITDYRYLSVGYGVDPTLPTRLGLRFQVWDTEPSEGGSRSEKAARLLTRIWDFNVKKLHLDHGQNYNYVVDVYFSPEGKAGGEQRMDNELYKGGVRLVNTIYLYKFEEIIKPIEMVREIAHEYGHASLPPVGGFKTPEDWANGFLGERLFMLWLFDAYRRGEIGPEDVFGATQQDFVDYLKSNVQPLVQKVLDQGPDFKLLAGTGGQAMNEYLGLVLFAEGTYSPEAFLRTLQQSGENALSYEKAMHTALAGDKKFVMRTASMIGKKIWVPISGGKIAAGAKLIKESRGWAQVEVTGKEVEITLPPPKA